MESRLGPIGMRNHQSIIREFTVMRYSRFRDKTKWDRTLDSKGNLDNKESS
jgi:hypothetical protein